MVNKWFISRSATQPSISRKRDTLIMKTHCRFGRVLLSTECVSCLIEIHVDTQRTWRRFITSFRPNIIINLFRHLIDLPTAFLQYNLTLMLVSFENRIRFVCNHSISIGAYHFLFDLTDVGHSFRVNSGCVLFFFCIEMSNFTCPFFGSNTPTATEFSVEKNVRNYNNWWLFDYILPEQWWWRWRRQTEKKRHTSNGWIQRQESKRKRRISKTDHCIDWQKYVIFA